MANEDPAEQENTGHEDGGPDSGRSEGASTAPSRPRPVPAETPPAEPRPAPWVHLMPRRRPVRAHDTGGADG